MKLFPLSFESKKRIIIMAQYIAESEDLNHNIIVGDPTFYIIDATNLYFLAHNNLSDTQAEKSGLKLLKEYKNGNFAEVQF